MLIAAALATPAVSQDAPPAHVAAGLASAATAPALAYGAIKSPKVDPKKPNKHEIVLADNRTAKIAYGRKGLTIQSADGSTSARIRWRTQIRMSSPFDSDPRRPDQFAGASGGDVDLRRARFKVDGRLFGHWLKYDYEHELSTNTVLNLSARIKAKDWLQFRAGQWKVEFSRERVTSSSKQQFVERSIVNREFTVDRQAGFEILGHIMPGSRGDSWYYAGVFTGAGLNTGFDADGHPMLLARYQWNFLGRNMDFSSSDLEYHESPAASVAVAGVTNRSRFTRYSSSGGGQLDGFAPGVPGQYSLKQAMGEFFLKYRGLSVQNEFHWKNVYDNLNSSSTDLRGSYAQAGYFPGHLWRRIPRQLEIGYRYGFVDPSVASAHDLRQEHTAVLNIFFEGHDNKLSFEAGRLSLARADFPAVSEWRYRIQWDIHF